MDSICIFIGWMSETRPVNWSVINLIVFFVLCIIPYQSIKINTLGMTESESKKDTYEQNSIFFSTDYEKLCPFTRKEGFLKYFQKLLEENIIDEKKCKKIMDNIMNLNEMDSYIKSLRHIENFCATQELNNIYMRNKNLEKEQDIIKNGENQDDPEFLEKVIRIKDYLYSFSTTAAGISNALIFLDEKNLKEEENFTKNHKNYNPWKTDWIFSENYLEKRKNLINEILANIDYKGEISDDEDTIIDYREESFTSNANFKTLNLINKISQDKEDTKSTNANKNKNVDENIKNNIISNNDEDEKEKKDLNIKTDRKLDINEEERNDAKDNINSEKSESIKFNSSINKFKNENDIITDNNFAEKPNIFNYDNTPKNSSERSLYKKEKQNEDIDNFFNKNNNNNFIETSREEEKNNENI